MKHKFYNYAFLVLFFMGLGQLHLQAENSETDSLKVLLANTTNDTTKINLLLKLSKINSWSDVKSSVQYAKQALQLSQKINYKKGLAYSNFHLAKIFTDYDFDLSERLLLH